MTELGMFFTQLDEKVKESFHGKAAEIARRQSRENMRPFSRQFDCRDVGEGILEPLVEIMRAKEGNTLMLMMAILGPLLEKRMSSLSPPPHQTTKKIKINFDIHIHT